MAELDIDRITVRRATHTDCTGIKVIIRDLYNGNDKFLYIFHKDVNLATSFPYMAEIAGEIVAYTCGEVKEDGEIITMREGRVCGRLQGKSVINKLTAVLLQAAVARFPNLQTLLWTSGSQTAAQMAVRTHPYIQLLSHGPAEKCKIPTATLKALCESDMFRQLEKKYPTDAIAAVPKREALRLLTEEIRFLDYAPTRPIIGWQPSGWHCSTLVSELQVTDLFITRASLGRKIEAFSFFTATRSDAGARFEIITHCAPGDQSSDVVIAHMLQGLREIDTLYTGGSYIICTFHFPPHVNRNAVLTVLNGRLGIASNVDDQNIGLTANMLGYKLSAAADYTKSRL